MANPALIQKQIKDNSEDLHNYMRDLKLWEEEMKRKDRQLNKAQINEKTLPPVRRMKLSSEEPAQKTPDIGNKKRIPSHDYKSWDKFDVDKACEEIDREGNSSEEEDDEELAKQKYLKEKALFEKELGNQYVKACKWDDAIKAYSRAISNNPRDPIFFANRALCYLKKKDYPHVEADCTEALKLDSTYVKAYLRRAAAREAVKLYADAHSDLKKVLQLEPTNTQAKFCLDRVTAAVIDGHKNSVLEETRLISNDKINSNKKEIIQEKSKTETIVSETAKAITENEERESTLPEPSAKLKWDSCSHVIQPICKPPHLRSKKSLKRIEIHDVGSGTPKHICPRKLATKVKPENGIKPDAHTIVAKSNEERVEMPSTEGIKTRSILTVTESGSSVPGIPSPPRTSVQFHTAWKSLRGDISLCYRYLKQIPGHELSSVFKESLESHTLSNILEVLAFGCRTEKEKGFILSYLQGLTRVPRFTTMTLFFSSIDKTNLASLFEHCSRLEECSTVEISQLQRLYELT